MAQGFCITRGKGFQMTFANGYTISIQFGMANYCENREMTWTDNLDLADLADKQAGERGCENAEIAVWDCNRKWVRLGEHDDVIGWQTPEQVAKLIAETMARPKVEKK